MANYWVFDEYYEKRLFVEADSDSELAEQIASEGDFEDGQLLYIDEIAFSRSATFRAGPAITDVEEI